MLQEKTIDIIKSTVPLLQEKGVQITTRFYEILFAEYPELLNIFNHMNQKQGRQQQALANAVYAAAQYIDRLEVIVPVVKQIAHKHRSLGVKAEHYPIVGTCLLRAIDEVVEAPKEVLDAWGEAYGVIADVFISVEAEMYEEAASKVGGWKDFRNFIVVKKERESDVITSFYLRPADGGGLSSFLPGQYVTVQLKIEGEVYTHHRQYSLSDAPNKEYYRISVKREARGVVSNYLHEHVEEGDVIPLSAPAGDFVLNMESKTPIVLISGGVGITPMMSMLHTAVQQMPNHPIYFIHGALNSDVHAMKEEVKQLTEIHEEVKMYTCYSQPTERDREIQNYNKEGFIDLSWLQSIVPSKEAEFYFCGPVPFMRHINEILTEWGVSEEHIHFEFFGPATSLQK
ncbi:dihydropteridine reductase [Bacillus manliponensis]|uniref:Flavohemoprotein n=1 Tax=Bacillus manliponensis TaxID=574376 RepID=A0A073K227_9BACI|nr:NO-inducible flavohemoprotein [Bacillus manliponensis]KEK20477.1 dihydropteridine reductase [Bacillus manliponensis]